MRFKDETFPIVSFEEFCTLHRLEVTVRERAGEWGPRRYFATCDDVEVMTSDGMLRSVFGDGSTKEEACLNYSPQRSGCKIAVDAMSTSKRRELQCPNEWKA